MEMNGEAENFVPSGFKYLL